MQIPEQTAAEVLAALEQSQRWHNGDKFRQSEEEAERSAWEGHHHLLDNAIGSLRAALATTKATAPVAACTRCAGKGVVDDGEINCYSDGTPYSNGPVKCVKDCPVCKGTGRAAPPPVEAIGEPVADTRDSAEAAYTAHAFNLPKDPVGSRDWTLYYAGWLHRGRVAALAASAPGAKGEK